MKISHNSFKRRVNTFRHTFEGLGVDAFFIDNPTDILYFTGLKLSRGALFISQNKVVLCVDGRYRAMADNDSPFPVRSIEQKDIQKMWQLTGWNTVSTIGFDPSISFNLYQSMHLFFKGLNKTFKPCNQPFQKLRALKDKGELDALRKSAQLLVKSFEFLKTRLKVGVTERELAHHFEWYCKEQGAESLAFEPIIAFGAHTAFPHYRPGTARLKKGDLVLIDIGLVLNGYASDMTRMIFFGEVSQRLHQVYKVVLEAHNEVLKACKPGVEVAHLDAIARRVMGKEEKYFLHSLGHGIGLDVHEYPLISKKTEHTQLEAGMVVTIEPGLYFPGLGGIRYEDMIMITQSGYQNLFKDI